MRHFLVSAVVALGFLMSTSMASAFKTSMTRIDGGGDLDIGDTVEVEVYFDSEEQADITIVSVSVLFDPELVTYVPGASLSPSYALYNAGGRGNINLQRLSTNLTIRAETNNQVLLDWSSSSLPSGNRDACGFYGTYPAGPIAGEGCGFVMARVVFETLAEGAALFELSSTSPGNLMQANVEGFPTSFPNPVSGDFVVTIPEPTSASLSIFALLSLAGLRLRAARH